MLKTLKLLLPAIIPSWNFFDTIAPSPRIEFSLLKNKQDVPVHWQEFRPRPDQFSIKCMLKRLLWNPNWNESLFLVSCSERLIESYTDHSYQEIVKRIRSEINRGSIDIEGTLYFQFRLVFVSRQGTKLQKRTAFTSSSHQHSEGKTV